MAMSPAAKVVSRPTDGMRAARTEAAARPTPSKTSAHDPVVATAEAVNTSVAVTKPPTAMPMRAAFPNGRVAQAPRTRCEVVIVESFGRKRRLLESEPVDPARSIRVSPHILTPN